MVTVPLYRVKASGCRFIACLISNVAFVPTFTAPVPNALLRVLISTLPFSIHVPPLYVLAFVSTTVAADFTCSCPPPECTPLMYSVLLPQTRIGDPLLFTAPLNTRLPDTGFSSM